MEKKIKNNENATVQLPVLALRGLVLFPHMVLHFDVGREQSLHSLNMAMNGDRKVFLVAQARSCARRGNRCGCWWRAATAVSSSTCSRRITPRSARFSPIRLPHGLRGAPSAMR